MGGKSEWDHRMSAGVEEGPADCIRIDRVAAALRKMKGHEAPCRPVGVGGGSDTVELSGCWICVVVLWRKVVSQRTGGRVWCCWFADGRGSSGVWMLWGLNCWNMLCGSSGRILEHGVRQQIDMDDVRFGFVEV